MALVLLDALSVIVLFNFFAWTVHLASWSELILAPLLLPATMHFLAIYLIDGYNPRTDMMSVTYTSLHAIALVFVLLFTLLFTYAVISAGFPLQGSRFVTTSACLALIPVTLFYRRAFYQKRQAHRQQQYFLFLGSPENCIAFKEECRKTGMTQSVLYATHATFARGFTQPGSAVSAPPFGDVARYLEEYEGNIDAIILRESSQELPQSVAQKLMELHFSGVPTYTLELFHEVYWRKIPLYRLNQTWLFQEGFQIAREPVFERLKRLSDIALASSACCAPCHSCRSPPGPSGWTIADRSFSGSRASGGIACSLTSSSSARCARARAKATPTPAPATSASPASASSSATPGSTKSPSSGTCWSAT